MPNWVYNNVTILGSESDLSKFYDKATALHPVEFDAETGEFVMTTEQEFSFWNFVSPPVEALKSGEYWGTHGFTDGKPQGNTENNWYHWNIREWGVKWNANNAYFSEDFGSRSISGSYDTAWSIPEPVMTAMVEQHPELVFIFHCEEEQGWGAEYSGENGRLVLTREFDVPSSHADYVERDNEDGCACAYSDDEDDWYGDCPRPEQDFYVVVSKTYKITASNAETAWELAQDNANGLELQVDETTAVVKDENGKRVYPLAESGE